MDKHACEKIPVWNITSFTIVAENHLPFRISAWSTGSTKQNQARHNIESTWFHAQPTTELHFMSKPNFRFLLIITENKAICGNHAVLPNNWHANWHSSRKCNVRTTMYCESNRLFAIQCSPSRYHQHLSPAGCGESAWRDNPSRPYIAEKLAPGGWVGVISHLLLSPFQTKLCKWLKHGLRLPVASFSFSKISWLTQSSPNGTT